MGSEEHPIGLFAVAPQGALALYRRWCAYYKPHS